MTKPNPPPAVVAINRYRELAGLTNFQAAGRAGISEAQWRLYTAGHRTNRGNTYAVAPSQEILARMAQAVGMPPDRLARFAGNDEAVEYLELLRSRSLDNMSPEDLINEIEARLAALRARIAPQPGKEADPHAGLRGLPGYVPFELEEDEDDPPATTGDLDAQRRRRSALGIAGQASAAARPDERDVTLAGGVGIGEPPETEPSPRSRATRRDDEKG